MIISNEKKFIFIHLPKTAGMSIKKALKKYDDRGLILKMLDTPIARRIPYVKDMNPLKFHGKAFEFQEYLSEEIFNKYFKFVFVRNPWSWLVSMYYYIIENSWHHLYKIVNRMSFSKFLYWRKTSSNFYLQKDFVVDKNDNIIVDYIGKVENIKQDFDNICNKIKVDAKLPHKNKSGHKNYKKYYNHETIKLVEEHYAADIDLFDYEY